MYEQIAAGSPPDGCQCFEAALGRSTEAATAESHKNWRLGAGRGINTAIVLVMVVLEHIKEAERMWSRWPGDDSATTTAGRKRGDQ